MRLKLTLTLGLIFFLALPVELLAQRGGRGGGRSGGRSGQRGNPSRNNDGEALPPSPERVERSMLLWVDKTLEPPPPPSPNNGGTTEEGGGTPVEVRDPIKDLVTAATPKGAPAILYFAEEGKGAQRIDFEEKLFKDPKVAIGAGYFNLFRFVEGAVKDENLQKKFEKPKGPILAVVNADGSIAKQLKGWRISSTTLMRALESPFKLAYGGSLSKHTRDELKLLDKLDQLYQQIAITKDQLAEALLADSNSARRKEIKLSKELGKLEVELEEVKTAEKVHSEAPHKKLKEAHKKAPEEKKSEAR